MPKNQEDLPCTGPYCTPEYKDGKPTGNVICPPDCPICLDAMADWFKEDYDEQKAADRIDGYDRDDLGESPDY